MRFLRDVSRWGVFRQLICTAQTTVYAREYQMPPTRESNARLELLPKCHRKPQALTLAVFCSLLFEGNQNPSFRRGAHI